MLRVDVISTDITYSYIMFAGNETSYTNATGTWELSDFATDWGSTWSPLFFGYVDHTPNWMTGDGNIVFTDSSGDNTVYNIEINPTLSESLFTPPV
jgi:hypothetical protein